MTSSNKSKSKSGSSKAKKDMKAMKKKEDIKRFLKAELKKEIKPLFVGSIAMVCSALSNQAVPRLMGKVLDQNSTKSSSNTAANANSYSTNYLLLIVLGGGLSSFLRTTMLNRAQDGIKESLRSQLFRSLLLDREMEWYHLEEDSSKNDDDKGNNSNNTNDSNNDSTDKGNEHEKVKKKKDQGKETKKTAPSKTTSHSPSAIQSILTKDVDSVSSTISTTCADTFRSTCSVVFATKNMFDINSNLLYLSLGIVPIIGSAAVLLNKVVKKISFKYHDIIQQSEAFVTERIEHIATVKTSNRERDEIDSFAKMQLDGRKLSRRASIAKGMFMGFMFSSTSSVLVLLFHIGGKSVASGKMSFGELKTFATYTFMLGLGTSGIMKGVGKIIQGMVCAERIYDLMNDSEDEKEDKKEEIVATSTVEGDNVTPTVQAVENNSVTAISLSGVNFAYASDSTKLILKDITISIQRGQVIALAGANGSGKSTLASLLVALYKPQNGEIIVTTSESDSEREIDFFSLDREVKSSLVQLVPQQPALFDMSIRENVTYTNPNATEEELQKALKASNCNGFISKLKGGLEYNVGRNGCKLSGGQRQRLALARSLLCDPALLILDEPNSSMDAEGDNAVADAVKNCRSGSEKRGLLLITHKVTSLELADLIVVLKDGEIVEQGAYDELVGNKDSTLCQLMPDLQ